MNKERKNKFKIRYLRVGAAVFLLVLIISGIFFIVSSLNDDNSEEAVQADVSTITSPESVSSNSEISTESNTEDTAASFVAYSEKTSNSLKFGEEYDAKNAVLICADNKTIVAYKDESLKMYPALLTKVMPLIVAVENISDLSDTVLTTDDMVNPRCGRFIGGRKICLRLGEQIRRTDE